MEKKQCFNLGKILKPHGVRGLVKLTIEADDPNYYKNLELIYLDISNYLVPFRIEEMKIISDNRALCKFENINDRDRAKDISNTKFYIPLSKLPAINDHEFYYHDLIDYYVHDNNLGKLGSIYSIYYTPQILLAMKYKNSEVLIPNHPSIVKEINSKDRIIYVSLPDGLLDVYLSKENNLY